MLRRALLTGAFLGSGSAAQKWGATNLPPCPVCRALQEADAPEYLPIVGNSDGTQGTLINARDCFCQECGVRFVAAA